jgi:hypothetical protein
MIKDDENPNIKTDYDTSRETYLDLMDKGQSAMDMMMEVARESEHPRAYEVLSGMMKNIADITDKLMDLNKKEKELKKENLPVPHQQGPAPIGGNTTNNVFVGTTEELQRLLQGDSLSVEEKDITPKE